MADKTISQLTEATSLIASDVFPIVTAGETKKVSVDALSSSLTNLKNSGTVSVSCSSTVVSGAIPLTTDFTQLSNLTGATASFSLANGTEGQVKELCSVVMNADMVVSCSGNGFTTMSFTSRNQGCRLIYKDYWCVVSNNGVTYG
jgi:hypothetical protein